MPEEMDVLLVLGDPGDAHVMDTPMGMVADGSVTGYLVVVLGPSPGPG